MTFMDVLRAVFTNVASTWQASSPIVTRIKKNDSCGRHASQNHLLKQSRESFCTVLTNKGSIYSVLQLRDINQFRPMFEGVELDIFQVQFKAHHNLMGLVAYC